MTQVVTLILFNLCHYIYLYRYVSSCGEKQREQTIKH